jgi:hypothetical protein
MANDTTDSTAASPSDTVDEFPGYPGFKLGDPVPGQPGTNIGDPIFDDAGNRWNWRKGEWEYVNLAQPPSSDKGGVKPGDETPARDYYNPTGTPTGSSSTYTGPTVTKREDGVITYNAGTGYEAFPGRLPIVLPGSSVKSTPILDLSQPPVAPVAPVAPPKPPKPITLPGSSVTSTPSIVEPTTVPIPARRMQEALNPYNGYINYDPDEILAAAMRVMNGRMAGRSMLNDLRR